MVDFAEENVDALVKHDSVEDDDAESHSFIFGDEIVSNEEPVMGNYLLETKYAIDCIRFTFVNLLHFVKETASGALIEWQYRRRSLLHTIVPAEQAEPTSRADVQLASNEWWFRHQLRVPSNPDHVSDSTSAQFGQNVVRPINRIPGRSVEDVFNMSSMIEALGEIEKDSENRSKRRRSL